MDPLSEPPRSASTLDDLRRRLRKAWAASTRHNERHAHHVAQHLRKADKVRHPGSAAMKTGSLQAGLETGLPGLSFGVQVSAGLARSQGLQTYATLEVASALSHTFSARAGGGVNVAAGVAQLGAEGGYVSSRTDALAADSPEHHAHLQADAALRAVVRRRGWRDRLRAVFGLKPRAHDVDAHRRLELLLQHPQARDAAPELVDTAPLPRPPTPVAPAITVVVDSTTFELRGTAAALGLNGSVSGSRNATDVSLDIPVWLPAHTLSATEHAVLLPAMVQRLQRSLGQSAGRSGQSAAAQARALLAGPSAGPVAHAPAARLLDALEAEFEHLQQLARVRASGIERTQVDAIEASLFRDWGADSLRETLTRLHQTAETLMLALDPRHAGRTADGVEAHARLGVLLTAIHDGFGREFGPGALLDLYASRPAEQHSRSTTYRLSGGYGAHGLGAEAGLQVSIGHEENYNPMRHGRFIEVAINGSGQFDPARLTRTVASLAGEPAARVAQAMTPAIGAVTHADATVTTRSFKPDYLREAAFSARDNAFGLEQIRAQYSRTGGLHPTARLPVAPGLSIALGGGGAHATTRAFAPDSFGDGFWGASLVRYAAMQGQSHQRRDPWQRMVDDHAPSLLKQAQALAADQGSSRRQAEYWMARSPAADHARDRQRLDALVALCREQPLPRDPQAPRSATVLAGLKEIYDQMAAGMAAEQARSPLMGALALRDGPGVRPAARGMSR